MSGEETQREILEVPARLASQAPQLRILEPHATRGSWRLGGLSHKSLRIPGDSN